MGPALLGFEKTVEVLDQRCLTPSIAPTRATLSGMKLEAHTVENVLTIVAEPNGVDLNAEAMGDG
jgi:hypothetical protein